MWNAPWLGTVNGLVAPYDGPFTVHSEYPMFIPSLIVKDLNLRRRFEENGLDYHDIDDGHSSDDGESQQSEAILPNALSHQGESRQSARIPLLESRAEQREEKRKKNVEKALRKERAQLRLEQADARDEAMFFEDYSNNSAATVPGGGAKDEEPDILVNHVATVDLKMPTSQQSKNHYIHRAGKKVYHYCTALIGELKPPPSRSLEGEAHESEVGAGLRAAQSDLLEYCAAYFECHPKAKSVIALAAAGPFWKWTLVYPKYVPEWNWILNEPADIKVIRWLIGTRGLATFLSF
jgi:hypothetical protein